MALFDIFRKKEKEIYAKKKGREKVFTDKEKKKEENRANREEAVLQTPPKSSVIASQVLSSPHITEKATSGKNENIYVFKIRENANKLLVKKAVEELYGAKVKDVRVVRLPAKARFILGRKGRKSGYKKALVILKKGEAIQNI